MNMATPVDDGLPPRRYPQWTVVHKPRVAVRAQPDTKAQMLGSKVEGCIVSAREEKNGWITLSDEPGFMLIDGASVGLGALLERLEVPDTALTSSSCGPTMEGTCWT